MTYRMKFLFIATMILLCAGCVMEEKPTGPDPRIAQTATAFNTTEKNAEKIISLGDQFPNPSGIIYFRDPNTSICFAYFLQVFNHGSQTAWGGPSLATVNCELVAKALINPPPPPPPPPADTNGNCEQQLKQLRDQQVPPVQAIPELLQP